MPDDVRKSVSLAEELAERVLAGSYSPTRADACEELFLVDEYPQSVRLSEFTLFAEPTRRNFGEPRYLILQPHILTAVPRSIQRREIDKHVRPAAAMVGRI